MKPIILDLCGGTGAWSRPWAESGGYDVRVITLPDYDVRTYQPPKNVYGILAAPPCTMFAVSGNRWKRTKEQMYEAYAVLGACIQIIKDCQWHFWALENPIGKLNDILGKPVMYFNPCDFGDPWTKKTCLWGVFNKPDTNPVEPTEGSKMWLLGPTKDRAGKRSITPPGFARAFFEANRIRETPKR